MALSRVQTQLHDCSEEVMDKSLQYTKFQGDSAANEEWTQSLLNEEKGPYKARANVIMQSCQGKYEEKHVL